MNVSSLHDLRDAENRELRISPGGSTTDSSSPDYSFPSSSSSSSIFRGRHHSHQQQHSQNQNQQHQQRHQVLHHHTTTHEAPAASLLSTSPRRNSLSRPRRRAAAAQTTSETSTILHSHLHNSSSNLHTLNNTECSTPSKGAAATQHWRQDSFSDMSDHSRGSLNGTGGVHRRRNSSPSNLHGIPSPPTLFGLVSTFNNSSNNNDGGGGGGPGSGSSSSQPHQQQPPLPSLRVILSELLLICHLYIKYATRTLKQPCQRIGRTVKYVVGGVLGIVLLVTALCILDFYRDATRICTPPTISNYADIMGSSNGGNQYRPLVEYFIHGRGMGHYARSVAIVEELNQAGVDVRMFLSRSNMWRALHEEGDSAVMEEDPSKTSPQQQRGTTTAISVASLTPAMDIFATLSHILERIVGDCEAAANTKRYPSLIVSDGDLPGMLRAKFGGIPSVGISHGQLFNIAQKPSWVTNDRTLNRAWNKQGRLNGVASYFSEWQIATHFCFLESKIPSGVVARAPLRPEVIQMAQTRKMAQQQGVFQSVDVPNITTNNNIPQLDYVKELLLIPQQDHKKHKDKPSDHVTASLNDIELHQGTGSVVAAPAAAAFQAPLIPPSTRRKLVICYFRDSNGGIVVDALLDAGFDVLLFDTGYVKDAQSDPTRYGTQYIVDDRGKHRSSLSLRTYEDAMAQQQQDQADGGSNSNGNKKHSPLPLDNSESNTKARRKLLDDTNEVYNRNGDEHPRLIRVADRSLFVPLMYVADGVASSAGSQLMSECIHSGMPLLAMYLEHDGEQRLNVELSRRSTMCPTKPQVYGASFESFTTAVDSGGRGRGGGSTEHLRKERGGGAVRNNHNSTNSGRRTSHWGGGRRRNVESDHAWQELGRFASAVRDSPVSHAFYNHFDSLAQNGGIASPITAKDPTVDVTTTTTTKATIATSTTTKGEKEEEEPFHGLPDAAAIILEILKEVEMGG